MTKDASSVATNLVGRHATWYGDRGREGGTIVAVWASGAYGSLYLGVVGEGSAIVTKDGTRGNHP